MGFKAEGIQPGCVAIGIRSEEAKPLSDYVCSYPPTAAAKFQGFWIWVGSEMISGPPTLSRLWVGVTSPSLAASIALERSLWINQLHHPCVQKTSVFAYLVMKFAGPAQDNCGRAVCLPSQKARSALVYLTSTDLGSVEEGAPAKRRRISSVGMITDEVQKRLLERISKGYLGAYLWESGIRGQDVLNCLKPNDVGEWLSWLFLPCRIV